MSLRNHLTHEEIFFLKSLSVYSPKVLTNYFVGSFERRKFTNKKLRSFFSLFPATYNNNMFVTERQLKRKVKQYMYLFPSSVKI